MKLLALLVGEHVVSGVAKRGWGEDEFEAGGERFLAEHVQCLEGVELAKEFVAGSGDGGEQADREPPPEHGGALDEVATVLGEAVEAGLENLEEVRGEADVGL